VARRLDGAALDELRQMGDEDADEVAAELRDRHPDLDENDLVRIVLRDLGRGEQAGDETVRRWMFEGPDWPDWAEADTIRAGQAFFGDWPLAITTALFCVSLPCAYAAADGTRVLGLTSDFATKNAPRRIAETGQMLIDVMDLDGGRPETLRPGGTGYATVRGVRLLHAVVRRTLLSDPSIAQTCDETVRRRWCREEWGVPVNQEDLLGTLTTFTIAVFRGLDRLGVPYTPDEAEAYLHTWCVIGELLGILPDLLPLELDEAEDLADAIARRHHEQSEDGDRLMAQLLRQMEMSMPWGLRKLPRTLLHHLLPPDVVRLFAVPPPAWWRPALDLGCRAAPAVARLPGGRWLMQTPTELVGRSMIRMYVDRALAGEGPPFRVEPAVAARLSVGLSKPRRTLRNRRRRIRADTRAHKE
jgi:ER-bound oxygenase mpaB/B'/Rubber oxygenase, catalytic domain